MNVVTPNGGDSVAARSWPGLLNPLLRGEDLSAEETAWAMDRIMSGEATDAQIAGFAVALRAKGETVDEVTGLVRAMYAHANTIEVPGRTVDIVGTGGDLAKTVNISTMSAIVIAGTGAKVVKHGNRAASSASGSSDVLEKLGVNLELTPRRVVEVAEAAGITFCFAVKFHPALRYAAKARKGARRADHVQHPGPPHQPGPGPFPGGRRRGRPDGAHRRGRAGRPGQLGAGLPR
ncbi:Anthranilate phosphoribosyltransferase OS=Streptomyces sp. ACT-1 OX=1609288 GN=trpD PE=3 SV=1 [Streptomyces griseus subsp. griseus]